MVSYKHAFCKRNFNLLIKIYLEISLQGTFSIEQFSSDKPLRNEFHFLMVLGITNAMCSVQSQSDML